jgi:Flp pilus assembly protein TadG
MRNALLSFARRTIEDQSGQVLAISAVVLAALAVLGGLGMDAGRGYIAQARLQTYANAAALAAAGEVYNSGTQNNSTYYANSYSASTGEENAVSYLGTITTAVATECLNVLMPSGTTCVTGSNPNAVKVTESASIPTTFMALIGKKTMNISAVSTAAMQGVSQKWNVAIIQDATGSMAYSDGNCGSITQFQCALNGIQALLASTNPCAPGVSSCSPSTASLRVALFSFPNIMTQYLPAFNACQSMTFSGPAVPYQVHTLPIPGSTSYVPLEYQEANDSYTWSASYEVTYGASDADSNGFVSDFYAPSSTSTGGLNASSSIVQAVGYGGTGSSSKTGCLVPSPGGIALNGIVGTPNANSKVNTADVGEGITYYASVLYAAQAALTAEATAHPGSQNAIILLSDGQANTQWFYFPQGSMWQWPSTNSAEPSTKVTGYSEYDTLKSTPNMNALVASSLSTPNQEATGTISGVYPDFFDECQQAIVAGQYATSHGTRVYTVAYGAEDTGCGSGTRPDYYTDVTLVNLPSSPNVSFTLATLSPCVTMENVASSLQYFYSDYLQSGSGVSSSCVDNAHSVTSLTGIFQSIASTFSSPRLIPNSAT